MSAYTPPIPQARIDALARLAAIQAADRVVIAAWFETGNTGGRRSVWRANGFGDWDAVRPDVRVRISREPGGFGGMVFIRPPGERAHGNEDWGGSAFACSGMKTRKAAQKVLAERFRVGS